MRDGSHRSASEVYAASIVSPFTRIHKKPEHHKRAAFAGMSIAVVTALLLGVSAVAGVAGDAHVKDGRYKGTVGPGWPISFQVSDNGKTVEHLVAGFDVGCNGPAGNTPTMFHFAALTIHDRSFSGRARDGFGSKVSEDLRITGSFSGGTAKGKAEDTSNITSLPSCTEKSTFTATAG
jgi:hypothetical protein